MSSEEKYDVVGAIMDFESGNITDFNEVVELFKYLHKTGMLYSLQGFYQRTYNNLVEQGLI